MACNAHKTGVAIILDVDCRTKIRQKQFGKVTTCKTTQAVQNKLIIITILEVRRVKEVFSHLAQQ